MYNKGIENKRRDKMVKIKTEKHMTEKEYLHFLVDNADFENISHNYIHEDNSVTHSTVVLELFDKCNKTDTICYVDNDYKLVFKVNTEEEVNEDTKLDFVIELYQTESGNRFSSEYKNFSIKELKNSGTSKSLAFYILNDDLTLTLIWKDGKLVD